MELILQKKLVYVGNDGVTSTNIETSHLVYLQFYTPTELILSSVFYLYIKFTTG